MDGLIWATFFAGLVSIRSHPRNEGVVDLEELALMADEMLIIYCRRFPCRG